MNISRSLLLVAAGLILAGQTAAQTEEEVRKTIAEEREEIAREAEAERRMYDAERRLAEAARQMAKISSERLPNLAGMQKRFEFITGDKPRLGVTIGGEDQGPVEGVPILAVTPNSAAEDAGLRAGDVITSVNDESMSASNSEAAAEKLLDFMRGVEDGDTLEVGYERDGKSGKVEVEPRPVEAQVFAFSGDGREFILPDAPHAPRNFSFQWHTNAWGDMELVELNAGLGKYFGTADGFLVVNAPEAESWQLEDGDVIQKIGGREPTSVRHALRILDSYQAGESLEIEIMRDKKRRTLNIEMPSDVSSFVIPDAAPTVRPARVPTPASRPVRPTERT